MEPSLWKVYSSTVAAVCSANHRNQREPKRLEMGNVMNTFRSDNGGTINNKFDKEHRASLTSSLPFLDLLPLFLSFLSLCF